MSFEAVPCMFKSRQEDGNEAQLFGLLIRPSATTAQTQQSAPLPGALPIATLAASPSSLHIVPSSPSVSDIVAPKKAPPAKDGRALSRCGASALFHPNASTSNGVAAAAALFASGTPNGMPPILPRRPKNGKTVARFSQQQMRSLVQLPTKSTALAFEMVQSPSQPQVVSQLGSAGFGLLEGCEALSVSTSSSCTTPSLLSSSVSSQDSPSCSFSNIANNNSNNGLLAIHSLAQKTQSKNATGEKPTVTPAKMPRRRRSRQTLASEGPPQREGDNGRSNGGTTETNSAGGGADLLGDLHSIEYSQLVNSVITTEDYLPSQSDPIYTNMDMYSSTSLGVHQQRENGPLGANGSGKGEQKQQMTNAAEKNAASSSAVVVASSLCPAAIFIHNQQQQQSSSAPSAVRFVPTGGVPATVPAVVVPPAPPQQHPSHWHPYMGAHPGGPSHISSTPDSGIQSIDGSPPSVYTPPMVSPYATQVRSCESVNNGGVHNGMPCSSSSTICAVAGLANPSSASSYGTSAYSTEEPLLAITALNPCSSSSIFLASSSNVPPSLIIEQLAEGENSGETEEQQPKAEEEEEDFSDMPRLVPVTHTEHDEEVAEEVDHVRPVPGTSTAAEDDAGARRAAPLFHQGMSLHEVVECISSTISQEQLKQLPILIQRKAEEQKNNNLEGGGDESSEKQQCEDGGKEGEEEGDEEQEQNQQQQNGRAKRVEKKRGKLTESELTRGKVEEEEHEAGKEEEGEAAGEEAAGEAGDGKAEESGRDTEAARRARDIEQLAIYRARVRQQLSRKLTALLERVIRRMDKCHLNLSAEEEGAEVAEKKRQWPWKKMDWEEIHRRAETRGERWMRKPTPEEGMKGRGRKRKSTHGEEQETEERACASSRTREKWRVSNIERSERGAKREKRMGRRGEKEESKEDDQMKKRVGRKRRRKEAGEEQEEGGERSEKPEQWEEKPKGREKEEKQTKKVRGEQRELNEKSEGREKEEKQTKKVRGEQRELNEKSEGREKEEKQTKKVRGEQQLNDNDKSEGREKEEKQSTPPLILRIRPLPSPAAKTSALMTIKKKTATRATAGRSSECVHSHATVAKRKPSASPKPSSSSETFLRERCHSSATLTANDGGKNSAIGGRRWTTTTGRRTKGRGTPTTTEEQSNGGANRSRRSPRRAWRRGEAMPSPEHLLSDREKAIVHSKGCFLIRNMSRRRPIGGPTTQCQPSGGGSELVQILERTLTNFCTIFDRRVLSDRQLNELIRTVKLLFSSVHDPSVLLAHFDTLLKQFAVSSVSAFQNEFVRAQFVRLKRSIDFGKSKQSLQKDALSVFLEEGSRLPSPSASSGRRDTFHRPLTVDTSIDLSYLDSAHPVGQWDPDGAAKLSPTSDNRDHDCVRCICGIAEDDGVMSQCDRCHFWLHADCLDCPVLDDQQEFVCDFCTRRIATTPRVDIVLKPQPSIKLSGCTYFRTLVNSRGLQVRLNESVYVERLINDKHKSILRELHEECVRKQQLAQSAQQSPQKRVRGGVGKRKKGGKGGTEEEGTETEQQQDEGRKSRSEANNRWWPEQQQQTDSGCNEAGNNNKEDDQMPSTSAAAADGKMALSDNNGSTTTNQNNDSDAKQCFQFHRRDLRVFRIERLFCGPNGQRFIFGCYYARPHETFCDSSRTFYRNELFWTPLFDTLPLDSVVGRCLVLEPQIWAMGRPKSPRYLEDDVFVCEYQIDRNQRSFEKIPPKNRYYINTEPYVFNVFERKLTMRRDFTPFKITSCSLSYDNKPSSSSSAIRKTDGAISSPPLFHGSLVRRQVLQQRLGSVCSKISALNCFGAVDHSLAR